MSLSHFLTEMAKSKSKKRNSRTRLDLPRLASKPNPFEILAIKGIEFILLLNLVTFYIQLDFDIGTKSSRGSKKQSAEEKVFIFLLFWFLIIITSYFFVQRTSSLLVEYKNLHKSNRFVRIDKPATGSSSSAPANLVSRLFYFIEYLTLLNSIFCCVLAFFRNVFASEINSHLTMTKFKRNRSSSS